MKCGIEDKKVIFPEYEYVEGVGLKSVEAMECPNCRDFTFTEKQVEELERRMDEAEAKMFSFSRKITVSGRSLSINIPEDLARHLKIVKGKVANIRPIGGKRFVVEVR